MSSLNIASRALTTNLAALQVVGHNIANVNTPGFSRQSVQLTTAGGQNTGSGYFGKGVELVGIERAYNNFLTIDALSTSAVASADEARYQRLQQLESLFPLGQDSLGVALNNALNAWSAVTSSPTDSTARTVVIARAEEFASRLRDTAFKLEDLRLTAATQLKSTQDTINTLATKIADVNLRIIEAEGAGRSPNDLLDQRDQLMADLNKQIQTTSVRADNGAITVFVAGSQPLVLGGKASEIFIENSEKDPLRSELFIRQAGQAFGINQDFLGGGTLKGVLQFVNEDLPESVNALGRLTASYVAQVNAQHRLGLDLNGNPGGDFFTVAAMPEGEGTPGTAVIQPSVVAPTSLVSTDYQFRFTSATNVEITRLADGRIVPPNEFTFASNAVTVDGLRFDITGTVAAGEFYTFRPYTRAASSIDVAIAQPESLAAASPVKLETQFGLQSGLTVETLRVTGGDIRSIASAGVELEWSPADSAFLISPSSSVPLDSKLKYSPGEPLKFTVDGVQYELKLRGAPVPGDSLTILPAPLVTGDVSPLPGSTLSLDAVSLRAGRQSDIPTGGLTLTWNASVPGFQLPNGTVPLGLSFALNGATVSASFQSGGASYDFTVSGIPADGDQLTFYPGGTEMNQNFGNAQAMLDLRDVDSFAGVTLGDGYISVFSDLAGTVQAGKFAAQFSTTAATNAEAVRSNYSAVNLDEEAARMLQFQQAYQAVAKYLQTAQSTFDVLINSFS